MINLTNITELKNRKSEELNKKTLQVEKVIRDENGEIIELLVKEIRSDINPTEEGTQLNASSLKRTINDLIKISQASTSEKVTYDLSQIELPEAIKSSIELPTEGYAGSILTWQILTNTTIAGINGNILEITPTTIDQTITLQVVVSCEDVNSTKEFSITVKRKLSEMEKLEEDVAQLTLPETITSNILLPTNGENDSLIKWEVTSTNRIDGSVYLKNKNMLKVTRDNENYFISLKATISRPNLESVSKLFNITVLGYPTTYYPTEYNENFIQGTTLNSKTLTITSSNNQSLFVEVENEYEEYIKTTIKTNDSTIVKVNIEEQQLLNNRTGSSSLLFTMNIKVYTSSSKENLLGKIPCTIYYYFLSTEPED